MASKLYVGGLPYSISDQELNQMFTPYGTVESARIVTDRATGQSRGFGFVEMSSPAEAQSAIAGLDSSEVNGRRLVVNIARPPQDNRASSFGGGGGRGGRRSY